MPLPLASVFRTLRRRYGAPPPPITRDPFELILWEQVAYLAPDERRRAAFDALRTRVGVTPQAVLTAAPATLESIARMGGSIAVEERAARMQDSAHLALDRWDGNLHAALELPEVQARRALARFPMIGEPGADRILAITGAERLLPIDSNALRVLQRLGLAPEGKDYRASYRLARAAVSSQLPRSREAVLAGGELLRMHGQQLCRRSAPSCPDCPLRADCPSSAGPAAPVRRRTARRPR